MVVVTEWPIVLDCDSSFRGFESRQSPQNLRPLDITYGNKNNT